MRSWQVTAVLLLSVVVSTELHAQPKPGYAPSSTHIYPAGARRGTKVRVLVGAECIPPETRFKLFGKGVSAPALLTQRVDALHEPSLRRKPTTNPITIPREWQSEIAIDKTAALRNVHWRLSCAQGGTALRPFVIGDLPEFLESESNSSPQTANDVTMPVTINGRIYGERDNDYFRFSAEAGDVVVCDVLAHRLQSRLDPIVEILDADGRPVTVETIYVKNDPVIAFRANSNGEFLLRIANVSHHGDAAHVYRINLSTRPYVRSAFPTAGSFGSSHHVEFRLMTGTNKTRVIKKSVKFVPDQNGQQTGSRDYRLQVDGVEAGNAVSFAVHRHRGSFDNGDNDQPESAQKLEWPVTVNGRLESTRDQDRFSFHAEKGTRLRIVCAAAASGSVAMPTLQLRDANGKQISLLRSVESEEQRCFLDWHVPQTGRYQIRVRDQQFGVKGGAEFLYRLTIAKSNPDFALEIPAGFLNLTQGKSIDVPVIVRRFGGFEEPISLTIEGLPEGVTAKPMILSGKRNRFELKIKASEKAPSQDAVVKIVGRGRAGLAKLEHAAVAKSAAINESVHLTVQHRPLFRLYCAEAYLYAHRGSVFRYPMTVERLNDFKGEVTIQVGDRQNRDMDGIEIGTFNVTPMQSDVFVPIYLPETMHINVQSQSQLYSQAYAHFTDERGKRQAVLVLSEKRNMLRTLPPVVKLKTEDEAHRIKPNETFNIALQLDRTTNFPGPMTVRLRPAAIKLGFSAKPKTIKAGQTKVVVTVTAPMQVPKTAKLTFRATGRMKDGTEIITEATAAVADRGKTNR